MAPTKANWDPPVNINRLSAWVCATESPAATDRAPKEMPYRPVATATDKPIRVAGVSCITVPA